MSRLIRGHGNKSAGYPLVNLDRIVKFQPVTQDGKTIAYDCKGEDGETITRVDEIEAESLEDDCGPIFPNLNPNITLITFWEKEDGMAEVVRYPIVAWRYIGNGFTVPISFECIPSEGDYCIQYDSRFHFPEDCTFDRIEDVLSHFNERKRKNA